VDSRDVAQSCRRGLEASLTGAEVFVIAAGDTVMAQSNAQLVAQCFPGVQLDPALGPNETLLSIAKARQMLGYNPQHSWRA
jgi:nucleoside-diphosphate-sugar epimerase